MRRACGQRGRAIVARSSASVGERPALEESVEAVVPELGRGPGAGVPGQAASSGHPARPWRRRESRRTFGSTGPARRGRQRRQAAPRSRAAAQEQRPGPAPDSTSRSIRAISEIGQPGGVELGEVHRLVRSTSRTASSHAKIPARPVVSSVPSMSQKRTVVMRAAARARRPPATVRDQAVRVQPVSAQHFVVCAAHRDLGDAQAVHLRAGSRPSSAIRAASI